MINSLQKRPQSKSYKTRLQQTRPITRKDDQQQAEKCFRMGKQHQNRNDIQKAQKFYLQAIIHNPGHFKSYCNLGLCYKLRGQYPNSIQAYKQSLAINSQDAITNYNLANVYRLIGDQQKSISHYQIVINLKEKQGVDVSTLYLDSYNNLGICYKNIENYAQAIECFEKIMKEKPADEICKFNLAVCYLKLVRKMMRQPKKQNAMLIKENISKTTGFFQDILKKQPNNEVVTLALIELSCFLNPENQNLKKCLSQIEQILKKSQISRFLTEQSSKVKAYCLNLLKKYEESAEEYRKAMQKKKEQQEERKQAEDREKCKTQKAQKAKEKQEVKKQEQLPKKTQKAPQSLPKIEPIQNSTIPQQSVSQINPKQIFGSMLSSLLQNITTLLNDPKQLSQSRNLTQKLETMIQTLSKQQQLSSTNKKLLQKIRKELSIVGCSILGQKLIDNKYFTQAYNIYFQYFLESSSKTPITKQLLFLETHRAIASVLTSLGESQKAIQHYQIISQQFSNQNIHDKDPLQQLHSGLAVNYQSQGLHEKAVKQFEQAIKLNPKNYILYYNLGYCQHCAGMNAKAIESYEKFLSSLESQNSLETQSKQSYILQALMSIFVCSQGSLQQKLNKLSRVQTRIQEFCNSNFHYLLQLVDSQALMHYYLLACDLYQQLIFNLQKQPKQLSKQHKQKLFTIYINLLELANCPDRDQILINCGNLLFQQKQYFGALQFYEKVSKAKKQVFNIISLTRMNINQHQKAISCMEFALQCDKNNRIYETNFQIMKWAYGMVEISNGDNILWNQYQCQCDVQFDARVQFAKSLILKLTAFIQYQMVESLVVGDMTVGEMFGKIMTQDEDDSLWRESEALLKHKSLKKHIQEHCDKSHKDNKQQFIQTTEIKKILDLALHQTSPSKEDISKNFKELISKLTNPNLKSCSDYLNVLQQILGLYIFHHSKDQTKLNILKQVLASNVPNIKTYDLTFKDSVVQNSTQYPQKTFQTLYPSIQLKLQNIIQSLLSWETFMEGQFIYLLKIVQGVAYKLQLKSPVLIDYNFSCCKNLENCDKCFKKACFVLSKLLNIDCKQNFIASEVNGSSLQVHKQNLYTAFVNKFGKNLELLLKQSSQNKDAKILTFKLAQDTLPLQVEINFLNEKEFQKFFKELCAELSISQPKIDKSQQQLYLTLNKLVRVRCTWKDADFVEEILSNVVKSTLGMKQTVIQLFDSELLKQWTNETTIKPMLSKVLDVETFLQ